MGDLREIIEKLDYLAGLGIDLIWLNPTLPHNMIMATTFRIIVPLTRPLGLWQISS